MPDGNKQILCLLKHGTTFCRYQKSHRFQEVESTFWFIIIDMYIAGCAVFWLSLTITWNSWNCELWWVVLVMWFCEQVPKQSLVFLHFYDLLDYSCINYLSFFLVTDFTPCRAYKETQGLKFIYILSPIFKDNNSSTIGCTKSQESHPNKGAVENLCKWLFSWYSYHISHQSYYKYWIRETLRA